jgi:hypothetical protein
MTEREVLTKDERIAVLSLAAKTWDGKNSFNLHLGELTQFVQDGYYRQVFTIKTDNIDNGTDRTEDNEGKA